MHSGGEIQGRDVRQKDFCSAGSAFCNCFVIDDCPLLYVSAIWASESNSRGWDNGKFRWWYLTLYLPTWFQKTGFKYLS